MTSTKRNQKISLETLETTLETLDNLSEKKQKEMTLRQSVHFLRDKLQKALKKGYTYQDLSEILEQQEILISAATLKQYLTEGGKKVKSKKRSGKLTEKQEVVSNEENKKNEENNKTTEYVSPSQQDDKESYVEKEDIKREMKKPLLVREGSREQENQTKYEDISSEFNQY